jgi:small subunit ribosomal protein S21
VNYVEVFLQNLLFHVITYSRPDSVRPPSHIERWVITVAFTRCKDAESFESAFRRFKKSCEKAGILSEVKKREHFEKPSVRLKKKSISARKRALKKTRRFGDPV